MPFKSGNEEEQSRKLFVGGISHQTTDEGMRDYFAKFGNVHDCVVIREQGTDRSKGFGFVTFEKEEEADLCMSGRPHNLDGRQMDVKRAVSREESSKPGAHYQVKKIFIGGIKEGCDESSLQDFFGQFGSVELCEIPRNEQKQPKGFAFVTFTDFDVVDKLVAKRHHNINGIRCEVKKALSKQDMEKAKQQLETKQKRSGGGYERRGGQSGGRNRGSSQSYGGGSGGGGDNGYGSYDGYGGYGGSNAGYGGGNDYGSSWGGDQSNYGPMKSHHGQQSRSSGPYGGGYGGGGSSGSGGGGYGSSGGNSYSSYPDTSGYGGYGSSYGGNYNSSGYNNSSSGGYGQGYDNQGGSNNGYGGYGGQSQSGGRGNY